MIAAAPLAEGRGWSVHDCRCNAGPNDAPLVESRPYVSIALVVSGTFRFRGRYGEVLMAPGAILVTDGDLEFECRHDDSRGDHCIDFRYERAAFQALAAETGATDATLRMHQIRPTPATLALFARSLGQVRTRDPLALEELSQLAAATTLRSNEAAPADCTVSRSDDLARAAAIARMVEAHSSERLTLADLGRAAGVGRATAIRLFQRAIGITPYQYLLRVRLVAAARLLPTSDDSVTAIAAACGFNDLSEFTRRFKHAFGYPPGRYRRASAPAATGQPQRSTLLA